MLREKKKRIERVATALYTAAFYYNWDTYNKEWHREERMSWRDALSDATDLVDATDEMFGEDE